MKVHYHCYNKLSFVFILSQINQIQSTVPYFLRCILTLSSLLCLGIQNCLFLFSLVSAICPTPPISVFFILSSEWYRVAQKSVRRLVKFIYIKIPGKFIYYLLDLQKQYMCGYGITELGTTLYTLKRYKYEQSP
jgi:hypothetical protein